MKLTTMTKQRAMRVAACAAVLALAMGAAAATAQAGTAINRTMKLEPGGRFVLQTFAGSVSVMGSSESGACVSITSTRDDIQRDVDFEFQESPGEVRVTAKRRNPWTLFSWSFQQDWLHYDIRVPKNTQVDIVTSGGGIKVFDLEGDTTLRTSGGSIEAVQVKGHLRANSSGGTIRARTIQGAADLWTSGGGIEADAIDGPLRAYTSGGGIRIHGVTGRVDAHTSGGSIEAAFGKGNSQGGTLGTSGGSIEVKLDPAANLEIEASTSAGVVRSDLPLKQSGDDWSNGFGRRSRRHLHGTLGNGGALLRIHTSGGSIRLSAL
jgi:Toastrack DUF4097